MTERFTLNGLLIAGHEVGIVYQRACSCTVMVDGRVRVKGHPMGPWSMAWENSEPEKNG